MSSSPPRAGPTALGASDMAAGHALRRGPRPEPASAASSAFTGASMAPARRRYRPGCRQRNAPGGAVGLSAWSARFMVKGTTLAPKWLSNAVLGLIGMNRAAATCLARTARVGAGGRRGLAPRQHRGVAARGPGFVVLLLDVDRPDVVVRRRRCSRPSAWRCTSSDPGCCTCACRCGRPDGCWAPRPRSTCGSCSTLSL